MATQQTINDAPGTFVGADPFSIPSSDYPGMQENIFPLAPSPADSPVDGGAPAPATPATAPVPEWQSKIDELQRKHDEMAQKLTQRERDDQQRQWEAASQTRTDQRNQAIKNIVEEMAANYGVPEEKILPHLQEAAFLRELTSDEGFKSFEDQYLSSQRFRQSPVFRNMVQHAVYRAADELVATHLAPLLGSNMTPSQVIKFLSDQRNALMERSRGNPTLMEDLVKVQADGLRSQNRDTRLNSGAERTERGGGYAGVGLGDQQLVNRLAAREPMSHEDMARANAAMDRGVYPQRRA